MWFSALGTGTVGRLAFPPTPSVLGGESARGDLGNDRRILTETEVGALLNDVEKDKREGELPSFQHPPLKVPSLV